MKTKEKYNVIKNRLKVNDDDVAKWFGYKNGESFRKSSRYQRMIEGVVFLYEKIGDTFNFK